MLSNAVVLGRVAELQSTLAAGVIALEIPRFRGSTGLYLKDFKGKFDTPAYKIDPGIIALSAEIRAIEKQAAEELGKWTEKQVPLGSAAVRTSITVRFIEAGPPDDLGRNIPPDNPHQVVKLIETTAGVPSNEPTGPGSRTTIFSRGVSSMIATPVGGKVCIPLPSHVHGAAIFGGDTERSSPSWHHSIRRQSVFGPLDFL